MVAVYQGRLVSTIGNSSSFIVSLFYAEVSAPAFLQCSKVAFCRTVIHGYLEHNADGSAGISKLLNLAGVIQLERTLFQRDEQGVA